MLFVFSLKLVYSTMCGKVFKICGVHILENALNLGIFTHAPFSTQNLPPSFYYHTLGTGKLIIPPGSIFSKIWFPQQPYIA